MKNKGKMSDISKFLGRRIRLPKFIKRHEKITFGFDRNGTPVTADFDLLKVCRHQRIPYAKSVHTYLEAIRMAFPSESRSEINRWFRDKGVRVYGYTCEPDEDPQELFGGTFIFSVFTVGKRRGFIFK